MYVIILSWSRRLVRSCITVSEEHIIIYNLYIHRFIISVVGAGN